MNKKWLSIVAMMALMLVLAACTNNNNIKDNEENQDDTNSIGVEENNTDNMDPEEDENSEADDTTPNNEETDAENPDGEQTKDDDGIDNDSDDLLSGAQPVDSDEQDYTIHLLPNYTLTSEEPGKDSLYLDADGAIFMRIETMPTEEGTYDHLLENMLISLEASSSGTAKPVQLTDEASLPAGEAIEHAQTHTIETAEGPVTGILFEKGSMIVRLTIFDSPEAKYFNDFLAMGETIVNK